VAADVQGVKGSRAAGCGSQVSGGAAADGQGIDIVQGHIQAAEDIDRPAEIIGIVQGDIMVCARGDGSGAGHVHIAGIGNVAIGGDTQVPAHGGCAQGQGIDIVQGHVFAAGDADGADKVIDVIEDDIVGSARGQGGGAIHDQVPGIGDL